MIQNLLTNHRSKTGQATKRPMKEMIQNLCPDLIKKQISIITRVQMRMIHLSKLLNRILPEVPVEMKQMILNHYLHLTKK